MKLTKLSLAMLSVMGAGLATEAMALDLYVDTKTQQIYAEPGPGRVLLGEFQKVGDAAAQTSDAALKAEVEQIKQDLALKDNELKALDEHMKVAEEYKVKVDKGGLQAQSADGKYSFKLGGRVHADATYSNDDKFLDSKGNPSEANDGTYIRRARMRFDGVFDKDWFYRTEADFADDSVAMKDIFIEYRGWNWGTITVGQQKQNFSRELQESSNDLMFMERSLMDVLNTDTVDRAIGLNYQTKGKGLISSNDAWVAKLGIYGDSIKPSRTGTEPENDYAGDEGWAVSSRLTYNPILEKDKLIHLGVAGNYRTPDDTGDVAESKALRYRYRTTNNQSNLTVLDSHDIKDVDNFKMLGLEGAGMYGPFSAGGEYTHTWIERKDGSEDLSFDGWYAEAAWSITGESRSYKEGNFGYLKPKNKFSLKNGHWGAWELATRWSEVNLNDREFRGGQMSQLTVALNWYINENVRFMADYNRNFNFSNPAVTTVGGGDPDALDTFMMRGQVAF
ncbi:OprO/OprP family phosphate-selective porin [Methylomonas rapida]|uniref:Porin n=1 Tax=Methylomonas rapida TaxID=2963939 RepID=A0ABY7GJ01_9GAMM|nr:porin [Methylomonas rapida]WAR44354.1 porin [Methylomonas rapida]